MSASEARFDARLIPVSKRDGVRWLTVLNGPAATAYRARVARVAPRIESVLAPCVIANRLSLPARPAAGPGFHLEPWRSARRRLLAEARRRLVTRRALLLTDVKACFASIRPEIVNERLLELGCKPAEVRRIANVLDEFRQQGVTGLPVGPEPSAILANAVLEAADRAIAVAGADHLRWVDDFLVFAADADQAGAVLERLRFSLAALGLALSEPKTRLIEDSHLALAAIERGAPSALEPRL
ncbi:MAG: RNA-directed DNA polymerase [Actinomycetota bacterium]